MDLILDISWYIYCILYNVLKSVWFHWWGLEHVCCSVRQTFRRTQDWCSDGKVEFCFLRNHGKKRTRHPFSRGKIAATRKPKQSQIVMQTHPWNALSSNPSTNDALSHCAEVPIQNLWDLAVGRVLSKSPAHPTEFTGKKKSGTKRPLPKHELTSFALPWFC